MAVDEVKLTQFSHGAGCGCKIAPGVLQEILKGVKTTGKFPQLIVGNESGDDAAVLDIGNGEALISTTDFFMPVVDNAFDFGRIAATNALSDVYAMGGKPIMALAILGWPIEKLSPELAQRVLEGAKSICDQERIPLAGGHSIDSPEPFFGLSVNGMVDKNSIKQNSTAREGNLLYLTKAIGTGILTTALKRKIVNEEAIEPAVKVMTTINRIGEVIGKLGYVTAMTDVTGFGLLGHLIEACEGSSLGAEITYSKIKLIDGVAPLAEKFVAPDNTFRNWKSYESKVLGISGVRLVTMCDPQTSGGLLVAVDSAHTASFNQVLKENGLEEFSEPIGVLKPKNSEQFIEVV